MRKGGMDSREVMVGRPCALQEVRSQTRPVTKRNQMEGGKIQLATHSIDDAFVLLACLLSI